jgi:hypothetical protein
VNNAAEQRVAKVCETTSAYLSSMERPLLHLANLLDNVASRGGKLEGEALGWAMADVEALLERLEDAADYVRDERRAAVRFRLTKERAG